eukprot:213027-Hanusia_phi.AAC.1
MDTLQAEQHNHPNREKDTLSLVDVLEAKAVSKVTLLLSSLSLSLSSLFLLLSLPPPPSPPPPLPPPSRPPLVRPPLVRLLPPSPVAACLKSFQLLAEFPRLRDQLAGEIPAGDTIEEVLRSPHFHQ